MFSDLGNKVGKEQCQSKYFALLATERRHWEVRRHVGRLILNNEYWQWSKPSVLVICGTFLCLQHLHHIDDIGSSM